ncbi:MAG: hypothetical protein K2X27_00600, partial [Candidatus Obscuribacterales bacterium]|nr:hypothetical protein [Candidatus Obscuribacterales bacterium]
MTQFLSRAAFRIPAEFWALKARRLALFCAGFVCGTAFFVFSFGAFHMLVLLCLFVIFGSAFRSNNQVTKSMIAGFLE